MPSWARRLTRHGAPGARAGHWSRPERRRLAWVDGKASMPPFASVTPLPTPKQTYGRPPKHASGAPDDADEAALPPMTPMLSNGSRDSRSSRSSCRSRKAMRDFSRASSLSTEVMNALLFQDGSNLHNVRLPNTIGTPGEADGTPEVQPGLTRGGSC
eukprot:CAMPEP_0179312258 /NCGR_PEP_ID=MMETSP0797-20121207/53157_1 /TAXON_ID=47934 /ORGANISM="Dinophysis acuminata, Strain DAEP01" /LENGTH=156 /DNA_ID=CAMNT_0021022153 /DNA_START=26 /DNA_END=496 /DNA_ORIENTATION=-